MNPNQFTPAALLAKNSVLNFIGMLLPILVGVVAIPFAIKGLGTDGFGILSVIWVILAYLTLLDFGLSRATTKFTAESIKKNRRHQIPSILWTALILSFGFGCLGAGLLIAAAPKLTDSVLNIPVEFGSQTIQSLQILAATLPFLLISISLKGMLGASQRFDLVNAVHIPVSILNFVFPALSFAFGLNLSSIIGLIALSRILATVVYFFLCAKLYPVFRDRPQFDIDLLKKLLSYGGWITVTGVVSPILVYIDRFFIGSMLSMDTLTYYAAPLEALTRLRILPMAIMITLFPEFSTGLGSEGSDRIRLLFGKSMKIILLIMGMLSLILFTHAHDILRLWLGAQFADKSTLIFQIFAISILINFLALVPFTFLQGIGRPDLPAKFHLVEFPIYILILWHLTKSYGISGSAVAWGIRVTFDFGLLYLWSSKFLSKFQQILRANQIWRVLCILAVFGLLIAATHVLISDFILNLLLLILITVGYAYCAWKIVLDDSEKILVFRYARFIGLKHMIGEES